MILLFFVVFYTVWTVSLTLLCVVVWQLNFIRICYGEISFWMSLRGKVFFLESHPVKGVSIDASQNSIGNCFEGDWLLLPCSRLWLVKWFTHLLQGGNMCSTCSLLLDFCLAEQDRGCLLWQRCWCSYA